MEKTTLMVLNGYRAYGEYKGGEAQHKNLVVGDEPIEPKLISVIACSARADIFPKVLIT